MFFKKLSVSNPRESESLATEVRCHVIFMHVWCVKYTYIGIDNMKSPFGLGHDPSFDQTWIHFIQGFCVLNLVKTVCQDLGRLIVQICQCVLFNVLHANISSVFCYMYNLPIENNEQIWIEDLLSSNACMVNVPFRGT